MTSPLPILTTAEIRAAEAQAIAAGTSALDLMERAGAAAATAMLAFGMPHEVLVLCGPGNNGGDAYVVARHLAKAGLDVRVAATAPPATEPAQAMAARWAGPMTTLAEARPGTALVDGVFGVGLTRAIDDALRHQLAALSAPARLRVALDLPSGLAADDGHDLGAFAPAQLTVAFGTLKPAHVLEPGRAWCGRVVVANIGLGPVASRLHVVPPPLPSVPGAGAHKYSRGAVLVLGGPAGSGGAARLAARAALRAGAGLAMIAVPSDAVLENAARLDAVMVAGVADPAALAALLATRRFASVAAGPGLGASPLLDSVLATGLPAVLDADVFTRFAGAPERLAAALRGPAVLTPHEGEFARLFGELPGSKIERARAAAACVGAVVLLKGADTVIAAPDGRAAVNVHAAPWLATAGSGDVLTGIIAALLAQGLEPFEAACAGAWLHGDAGVRGGAGLTADDLPELLRQ